MKEIFITGIDTDIGKTIVTGLMAAYLKNKNINAITQKIVQTGCSGISEDILVHRKLMGINIRDEDRLGITCPYVFKYPASPCLAAKLENKEINVQKISRSTQALKESYEFVLIEGIGGLFVPLNDKINVIEYIRNKLYPVILVSSSKLGSINHTLLSIEALKQNKIRLLGIVYNRFGSKETLIIEDSLREIRKHVIKSGYRDIIKEIGKIDLSKPLKEDFDMFFD
jgi:dethiobiotin synthetase